MEKIALLGATCNNLYRLSQCFASNGVPFTFVQERKDNFPHSYPVWNDLEITLKKSDARFDCDWSKFGNELGWEEPEWYLSEFPKKSHGKPERGWRNVAWRYLKANGWLGYVEGLRDFDFAIVCGVNPLLAAYASGIDYAVWPQGTDMRLALGIEPSQEGPTGIALKIKREIFRILVTKAFKSSRFAGSHLPDGSAVLPTRKWWIGKVEDQIEFLCLPYKVEERLDKASRRALLQKVESEAGVSFYEEDAIYGFVPSRWAKNWKGQNLLIDALSEIESSNDFKGFTKLKILTFGWGGEIEQLPKFESGMVEIVEIPVFCSTLSLLRWFRAVDFVIDSLVGPGYGSALSEAISVGCPVLTKIGEMFQEKKWPVPQCVAVNNVSEIVSKLNEICTNTIDLNEVSRGQTEWFRSIHSFEAVGSQLKKLLPEYFVTNSVEGDSKVRLTSIMESGENDGASTHV